MAATAYVSFLCSKGNVYDNYLMRFNQLASVLLDGVDWVTMRKSDKYIILDTALEDAENPEVYHVWHDPRNAALISLSSLVKKEGAIGKSMFGKRYKVKRDRQGRVYICVKEIVGEVGEREQ